jgi:hypothetical protein
MNGILTRGSRQLIALSCMFLWARASQAQSLPPNDLEQRISVRISTERVRFQPGEDIRLHVEIRNEDKRDLFVSKTIEAGFSNALATIDFTVSYGNHVDRPTTVVFSDSFSSERSSYPPLASELPRYWIALPPQHFYGGDVVVSASSFRNLGVPGRYRIQGKYKSRGFLAQDINNPLAHYAQELKQLPFEVWVGEVETNSVWIEIVSRP